MTDELKTEMNAPASFSESLLDDETFRAIFGTQQAADTYLLGLINSILSNFDAPKVESLKMQSPALFPFFTKQKESILDLVAEGSNGEIFDIELQTYYQEVFNDRLVYYLSKLLARQLKRGQKYDKLRPVIGIALIGPNVWNRMMENLPRIGSNVQYVDRYYDSFQLCSFDTGTVFSSLERVYCIRIPMENLSESEIAAQFKNKNELPIWLKMLASRNVWNDRELDSAERRIPYLKELREAMNIHFNAAAVWRRSRNESLTRRKFAEATLEHQYYVEKTRKQFQEIAIDLDNRRTGLDNRETGLDNRETGLDNRETELNGLAIAVKNRETAVESREIALNSREEELAERERKITELEQNSENRFLELERQLRELMEKNRDA